MYVKSNWTSIAVAATILNILTPCGCPLYRHVCNSVWNMALYIKHWAYPKVFSSAILGGYCITIGKQLVV